MNIYLEKFNYETPIIIVNKKYIKVTVDLFKKYSKYTFKKSRKQSKKVFK